MVVESDKADMDVESFEEGYLASILVPEGGSAAVGGIVALIAETKDEISSVASGKAVASTPAIVTQAPVVTAAPVAAAPISTSSVESTNIFMPALSSTMTEGKIIAWNKKIGDKVVSGDTLLVVESDKADMDVEAFEEGYLAVIVTPEGGSAPVGAPVGILVANKEDIGKVSAVGSASASPTAVSVPAVVASSSVSAAPVATIVNDGRVLASGYAKKLAEERGVDLRTVTPSADGIVTAKNVPLTGGISVASSVHVPAPGSINASPMARKAAKELGLDVTTLKGTGNFGRVTEDDVLIAAGKKKPAAAPVPVAVAAAVVSAPAAVAKAPSAEKTAAAPVAVLDGVVAMDGMQKAVAKNMEKTLSVPVFRVSREIVTDSFDALYAALKPKGVTVSAMLAKAVAETLKKHPIVNAAYVEGGIKFNKDVNVAMAVAIDGGLITPTIIKAQDLDLFSISRTWKDLVDRAKSKKLTPAEYSSGTFTISNLGMFGVAQFDAILPPGTGSILAIAASTPKVVQLKNGHFGVQNSMTVTITCDHRHIYGASAAEFLKDLADLIENNSQSLTMG